MGAGKPGATGGSSDSNASASEYDEFLRAVAHAPAKRPPPDAPLGSRWGSDDRYVLERRLGRGGMGIVYAATDTLLGRLVALKVLDAEVASEVGTIALLREARLAASVEHERIARVYDVGEHDDCLFVAMEYVRGATLRTWMLAQSGTVAEAIAIATQIAEGLAALHEKRVIHRDLKPENVMLTEKGSVKLLDFGLARQVAHPETSRGGARAATSAITSSRPGSIASGTPGYMAPEQRRGERADARSDVFALGVVLYELVTGQRPFPDRAIDEITASRPLAFDGAEWRDAPAGLREFITRATADAPSERFADGAGALEALRAITGAPGAVPKAAVSAPTNETTTLAAPYAPGAAPSAPLARRTRRWPMAIAAGIVIVGGSAVVISYARRAKLPAAPPGMVWIDEGTIQIGRRAEQIEQECAKIGPTCDKKQMMREVPSAAVTVAPFLLDVHEITNDDMAVLLNRLTSMLYVVADEDDHYPRYVRWTKGIGRQEVLVDLYPKRGGIEYTQERQFRVKPGFEKLPVVQVSWYGARFYCTSLGKRLPTENEWEAAARGREDRRFPWGNAAPRCADVVIPRDGLIPLDPACPEERKAAAVEASAQDATRSGIRDLAGNVAEWTASSFVEGDRAAPPDDRDELPKVIRGGSWAASLLARTSGRTSRAPEFVGNNLGFRCAANRTTN